MPRFKIPRVLEAKARGQACFDFTFYTGHNKDLQQVNSTAALWKHYVYFGQFESRPYRSVALYRLSWEKAEGLIQLRYPLLAQHVAFMCAGVLYNNQRRFTCPFDYTRLLEALSS